MKPGAALAWLPTILVLALGCLWGAHFSIVKVAAESRLPLGSIIVATAAGAAFGLVGICYLRGRLPPISYRHMQFYIICALLSYGLPFILELTVASYLTAGLLTLIVTMDPIFTTAIAALGRRETVAVRRLIGITIGALASFIILIPGAALPSSDLFGWTLLAFAIPASYATYHTYVASAWPEGMDAWQAGAGEAGLSAVLFLPLAFWQGDLSTLLSNWTAGHWAIVLMIVSGILEAYLYFEIVRRAGAIFVSQAGFITVITGVIWGMVIFDETPDSWLWFSAACLLSSLYLTRSEDASA